MATGATGGRKVAERPQERHGVLDCLGGGSKYPQTARDESKPIQQAQTLILPDFPGPKVARALSPNGRAHWAAKIRLRREVEGNVWVAAHRLAPIRVPVRVTFRYVFPDRRRRDLDNLTTGVTKACLDSLVRGDWLEDDDSAHVVAVTAEVVVEKGARRLEIVLEPVTPADSEGR